MLFPWWYEIQCTHTSVLVSEILLLWYSCYSKGECCSLGGMRYNVLILQCWSVKSCSCGTPATVKGNVVPLVVRDTMYSFFVLVSEILLLWYSCYSKGECCSLGGTRYNVLILRYWSVKSCSCGTPATVKGNVVPFCGTRYNVLILQCWSVKSCSCGTPATVKGNVVPLVVRDTMYSYFGTGQ